MLFRSRYRFPRVGIAKRYLVLYRFAKNNFNKTVSCIVQVREKQFQQNGIFYCVQTSIKTLLRHVGWAPQYIACNKMITSLDCWCVFLLFGNVCVRLKNVSVLVDVSVKYCL